jgi:hypothetical protein
MSAQTEKRYRTKVDQGLVISLFAFVVITIGLMYLIPGKDLVTGFMRTAFVPLVWVASFFFMWPVEYWFEDSNLVVRSGLIRKVVPLSDISCVRPPGKDVLVQLHTMKAAFSTDRLLIEANLSGVDWVISVSPTEKAAFLSEFQKRDPNLISDGSGLHRRVKK